jgi:hypothetical protein
MTGCYFTDSMALCLFGKLLRVDDFARQVAWLN